MEKITITINRVGLRLEHPVDVFPVTLESKTGIWEETLRSEELLMVFLRGVEAGCSMCNTFISLPDIPGSPTKKLG